MEQLVYISEKRLASSSSLVMFSDFFDKIKEQKHDSHKKVNLKNYTTFILISFNFFILGSQIFRKNSRQFNRFTKQIC